MLGEELFQTLIVFTLFHKNHHHFRVYYHHTALISAHFHHKHGIFYVHVFLVKHREDRGDGTFLKRGGIPIRGGGELKRGGDGTLLHTMFGTCRIKEQTDNDEEDIQI